MGEVRILSALTGCHTGTVHDETDDLHVPDSIHGFIGMFRYASLARSRYTREHIATRFSQHGWQVCCDNDGSRSGDPGNGGIIKPV